MKKEQIQELFNQFENACYDYKDIECWSARELQLIFNYSEWRNFLKVIEKAKEACKNSGTEVSNHFVDVNKMVTLGSGSERQVEDIALPLVTYSSAQTIYNSWYWLNIIGLNGKIEEVIYLTPVLLLHMLH